MGGSMDSSIGSTPGPIWSQPSIDRHFASIILLVSKRYQRFNSGDNCVGSCAFDLYSDINVNHYSHFNLVNNSAPSGFFKVWYKVGNILSNFNFYFSEPTNWVYSRRSVWNVDCYVGGHIPPSSPYVVTQNLQEVTRVHLEKYAMYAHFVRKTNVHWAISYQSPHL